MGRARPWGRGWYNRGMEPAITLVQWFFVILAADLLAAISFAMISNLPWKKILKKKRKYNKRRKLAAVIPIKKMDKES